MDAWPRSAMTPPPGRPMLPSRSWRMAAVPVFVPRVVAARRRALVAPRIGRVLSLLRVPSGEQAVEILGVLEIAAQDRRRVRVVDDVVAEFEAAREDVVDEGAEEHDV